MKQRIPLWTILRTLLFALALHGGVAQAGSVLVVQTGGATGTYATIQLAVTAAADGDVVLVKAGAYSAFAISNKDLTVVADAGASVQVQGTVLVSNLSAARRVLLSGLDVTGDYLAPSIGHGLLVSSNTGSVRVDRCQLHAAPGTLEYCQQHEGALITNSLDVAFAHCTIVGTDAALQLYGVGGFGLRSMASKVAVYDCTLRGGLGGTCAVCSLMNCVYFYAVSYDGANGGSGIRVQQSDVFVSRSTARGGDGGPALPNPNYSTYGGCGGSGAELSGTGNSWRFDLTLFGGVGGLSQGGAPNGTAGLTIASGSTAFPVLPGSGRTLQASAVLRENNALALTLSGQPGDSAGVLVSMTPRYSLDLAANGVRLTAAPSNGRFIPLGTVPGGGTLSASLPIGDLGPGVQSRRFFVQSIHQDASGAFVLGTPQSVVVLDSAF